MSKGNVTTPHTLWNSCAPTSETQGSNIIPVYFNTLLLLLLLLIERERERERLEREGKKKENQKQDNRLR